MEDRDGGGKSRKRAQITTYMSVELRSAIEAQVDDAGVTMTVWCREAFLNHLEPEYRARAEKFEMTPAEALYDMADETPRSLEQCRALLSSTYGIDITPDWVGRQLRMLENEEKLERTLVDGELCWRRGSGPSEIRQILDEYGIG